MKHVVSLLTLGMSTLASAEHQITHKAIFKDTSQISMDETGTVTVSVASGSELTCEALTADGSAYPDYQDFQSNATSVDAPTRTLYAKGTTLAYRCGIRNMTSQEKYEFDEPPILFDSLQTGEFIRVDFSGGCTADSIVFSTASVTNNGTYNGGRNFTADLNAQLTYGCKQGKSFSPSVTAEVMLEPLTVATFVQDAVFSKALDGFTTTDGLIYDTTKSLLYDLGTDKPDHAYYQASQSCQSGLCKGALLLSSGNAKTSVVTDLMDPLNMPNAVTPSFINCTSAVLSDEKQYSLLEACYVNPDIGTDDVLLTVSGHLLVPLECPFQSATMLDSSEASIDACLQIGRDTLFDNRCQASLDRVSGNSTLLGQQYKYDLFTSKSFDYIFDDQLTGTAQRFREFSKTPAVAMTGPPSDIIVTADMVYFDASLHLAVNESFTDIINGAMNFRVLADTGWSTRVQLVGDQLTVTGVPKNAKTLKLVGDVRTGCDLEEIALSNVVTLSFFNKAALAFGDFRQTDPCSNVYLFYRSEILQGQKNLTIASIHGVKSDATGTIKVCGDSTADCDTVFTDVIDMGSSTDQFALISDACNYQSEISPGVMQTVYLSKDAVAGYVEFQNELALFAPIKCAGACHSRQIRLPDLSLDWEVDFKVSTTEYELSAKQDTADWDDFTKDSNGDSHFTMHKVSYLAPAGTDRCLADGSVSGDVPTSGDTSADPKGCLVFKDSSDPTSNDAFGQGTVEYSGITASADMRNWLASCGSYLEDGMGAKAQLVQRFEVDYEDGYTRTPSQLPSVESFCDSKDLTLYVEQKIVGASFGELTIAQVSAVEQSPDIQASIGSFDYEECTGGYRVIATVDLHHSLDVSFFQAVVFTGSSAEFTDMSLSTDKKTLTWKTACADVCGDAAASLATWTADTGHLLKAVVTASDATLTINHDQGAESDIELKLALKGTPCDVEKTWDGGEAALSLYAAPSGDCDVADDMVALGSSPAADGAICGRFVFSNMGEFALTITGTEVSRRTDGTLAAYLCEDVASPDSCIGSQRGRLFQIGGVWNSVNHTQASGKLALELDDAFTTIKYTIYWEQNYQGTARRLRSEHTFGDGQETSVAQLVILPPHAQIADAAEIEGGEAHHKDWDDKDVPYDQEHHDQHKTEFHWAWILGAVVAVGLIGTLVFRGDKIHGSTVATKVRTSLGGSDSQSKGYMKVRQDRFTASVF